MNTKTDEDEQPMCPKCRRELALVLSNYAGVLMACKPCKEQYWMIHRETHA